DNEALVTAINVCRRAAALISPAGDPLDWAMLHNTLGNALSTLGQRESDTTRLEGAAKAYREALKGFTRERIPQAWAATQSNLGNVLSELGERQHIPALLEEAFEAYREALKAYTRECAPLEWAMVQNNLGAALLKVGEWRNSTELL